MIARGPRAADSSQACLAKKEYSLPTVGRKGKVFDVNQTKVYLG
jgi:hypothetical protein